MDSEDSREGLRRRRTSSGSSGSDSASPGGSLGDSPTGSPGGSRGGSPGGSRGASPGGSRGGSPGGSPNGSPRTVTRGLHSPPASPPEPSSPGGPCSPDEDARRSDLSGPNSPNDSQHASDDDRKRSSDRDSRNGSPRSAASHRGPRSPNGPSSPPPGSPSPTSPPHKWSPKSESLSPCGSPKSGISGGRQRSESSRSSRSSRRSSPGSRIPAGNPPTEEISDGEMESDNENDKNSKAAAVENHSPKRDKKSSESNVNISHEDLSDVSDLDSMGPTSEDEQRAVKKSPIRAPDQSDSRESPAKVDTKINGNIHSKGPPKSPTNGTSGTSDTPKYDKIPQEKTSKTEDVEEQLDFEAEEGECVEAPVPAKTNNGANSEITNKDDDAASGAASSLEEGEVSDEEERRPEETEPRPVCRFYSRGQCTWGISCRFLHPGVTDKGNYTMFDMVRAMPASYGHHGPPGGHHPPPHPLLHVRPEPSESAWERGLRTAKEMLRKANKRKEQDSDFEEKKMHLSLAGAAGRGGSGGPEDEDADLAAYAGYPPAASPPPLAPIKREREEYYRVQAERRAMYEEATRAAYGERSRVPRYRETITVPASPPHHRAPSHYYEAEKLDERIGVPPAHHKSRRPRSTREVIVQRAPGPAGAPGGRGEEWADPWMRGGGAPRHEPDKPRRRAAPGATKYSSASSYSSSSSRSSNSSGPARSPSAARAAPRHGVRSPMKHRLAALSPSVIVQERRAASARALAMNPPAPSSRKRAPSPAAARQHAANPPPPHHTKSGVDAFGRTKPGKPKQRQRKQRYSKSSSSGSESSSSSSDSESESRSSSSSDSSARGPGAAERKLPPRPASPKHTAPLPHAQKKDMMVDSDIRKDVSLSKKRGATSPINNMIPTKKPVSRREELLKQLKAVEDAIARKRSKI